MINTVLEKIQVNSLFDVVYILRIVIVIIIVMVIVIAENLFHHPCPE